MQELGQHSKTRQSNKPHIGLEGQTTDALTLLQESLTLKIYFVRSAVGLRTLLSCISVQLPRTDRRPGGVVCSFTTTGDILAVCVT